MPFCTRRMLRRGLKRATGMTCSRTWRSKGAIVVMRCRDYDAKPELDRYESEGLDDEGDQAELGYEQRREVERQLDQEKRLRARKGGRAGAFLEDEEYSENDEIARQMRLERMRAIR
jgi:hypothetical protein